MAIELIDMAKTPEEYAEEKAVYESSATYNPPKYPYGLCICLDGDMLDRLGLTLPEVGDTIDLCAFAKVTSVSSSERENGSDRRVELQITHLGLEEEEEDEEGTY